MARRASLIDDNARQIREKKMDVDASCSKLVTSERSTTNSVEIDMGTTKGDPCAYLGGPGKPDPHICL